MIDKPDHNVVCVELTHLSHACYIDEDFGSDEDAAMRRMRVLTSLGKRAWLEPFYGQVNFSRGLYRLVKKPEDAL